MRAITLVFITADLSIGAHLCAVILCLLPWERRVTCLCIELEPSLALEVNAIVAESSGGVHALARLSDQTGLLHRASTLRHLFLTEAAALHKVLSTEISSLNDRVEGVLG